MCPSRESDLSDQLRVHPVNAGTADGSGHFTGGVRSLDFREAGGQLGRRPRIES